jgi:uncharacterized membrane protein YhdT
MSLLNEWVWPDVSIRSKAQMAIDEAFWVAVAVAVYRSIWILIAYGRDPSNGLDGLALLAMLCFGGLAVGIRFRSRAAAVIVFALYVFDILYGVALHPQLPLVSILIALALFAAVRGTFAYRKLPKTENLPSITDTFKALKGPSETPVRTPPE